MRKKLKLMSTLVFFSLSSLASGPIRLNGVFQFKGEWSQNNAFVQERVLGSTINGRRRLEDLRSQGYACLYRSAGFYFCKKFIADLPLGDEDLKKALNAQKIKEIRFLAQASEVRPLNETGTYRTFEIEQDLFFGKNYDKYIYGIIKSETGHIHKIFSDTKRREFYLNVENKNRLSVPVTVQSVKNTGGSGLIRKVYYLKLHFNK